VLMFDGRFLGSQLREFIRALFDFPDPRAATSGQVKVEVAKPEPEPEPEKEHKDG
jgi:hypothetical protein